MVDRFKQKELPPFIGIVYDVFMMTSPLMSIVSYIMLSTTAYAVTRDWIIVWIPWLTFPVFLLSIGLIYLVAMMCVYKFLYASYFAHRNKQEYKHKNPIRQDIASVREQLDRIEKSLKCK
jgi:hypothetical protein